MNAARPPANDTAANTLAPAAARTMADATPQAQVETHAEANASTDGAPDGRAEFVPYAVIETERERPPGSLWMCGMAGGPMRFLHVALDVTQPPEAWRAQVLQTIASRLRRLGDGPPEIPFFGAVTGFVVNHAPDRAVRFDRDGVELEVLSMCRHVPLLARRGAGGRTADPPR
jgi:hypothetical protein